MTPAGFFASIGVIALIGGMAWLGWNGRWIWGLLLTLPFVGWLVKIEVETRGPSLFDDPYGVLLMMIVLGPIGIGWCAFLLFSFARFLRRKRIS